MKPSEGLKAAKARIEKRENWTQGVFARNERYLSVSPEDPSACTWCAVGAVEAVMYDPSKYVVPYQYRPVNKAMKYLETASKQLFKIRSVAMVNDGELPVHVDANGDWDGTMPSPTEAHQNVLRIYDQAIWEAEKERE